MAGAVDYRLTRTHTTIFPTTYRVSAGELTEAKRIPCCTPCYPTDPIFLNKKRRFASHAARIAAMRIQTLICMDSDSD
jgi:hypothetical protein